MQPWEHIDLRIWDAFYSQWRTITPVEQGQVSRRADFGVDTMTLTLPAPHPLDELLLRSRVIAPPITFQLNGIQWTGRISEVKKIRRDGAESWQITVASDDKHLHRLLAKTPVTSATGGHIVKKGTLAHVAEWMIARGVARTGLPIYYCAEVDGGEVEITARTEDTVADILTPASERQDVFIDVRTLTPDLALQGGVPDAPVKQYIGDLERRWYKQYLSEGAYSYAEPLEHVTAAPTGFEDIISPDGWFVGTAPVDHLGKKRGKQLETGICWNPFETQPPTAPSDLFYKDGSERVQEGVTRCATAEELEQLANTDVRKWFGVFVTTWAAGEWKHHRDTGLLQSCAEAGLLIRADGKPIKTSNDVKALDLYIGDGAAFAWQQRGQWIVANREDWTRESQARMVTGPQLPVPGVLVHLHGERDRRQVVFTTAPGGGLEGWEASITPPDAAALIAGAQWDAWMGALMKTGGVSEKASSGVNTSSGADEIASGRSVLSGAADGVAKNPAVQGVTARVSPNQTVDGTEVSFSTLTAGMDMAMVGTMFYREKYYGIGSGDWSADVAATFEQEWSNMQGSTSMQMTVGSGLSVVFGDDVQRPDGTTVLGWRPGDRISLIDGRTHLTEVISGWECTWSAKQPAPVVTPLLGKRSDQHTPVDTLVDTVRKIQKSTERAQVSPPRVPSKHDVAVVAVEAAEVWSKPLQQEVKEALQIAAGSREVADSALQQADSSTRIAEEAKLDSEESQNTAIRALTQSNRAIQDSVKAVSTSSAANSKAISAINEAQEATRKQQALQAEQITRTQRMVDFLSKQQTWLEDSQAIVIGATEGESWSNEWVSISVTRTQITVSNRSEYPIRVTIAGVEGRTGLVVGNAGGFAYTPFTVSARQSFQTAVRTQGEIFSITASVQRVIPRPTIRL